MLISATQRTSENIDGTKNLDGILLENMYIGLAEYYSAELSQKIRRGLHENRVKGYYSGGILPYGYYVEKKKVYIKEDEATIVRQIFQYYAQGITVKEILQDLAEKGITYRGRPFAMNTVYQMLRLEKYIGICRYDEGVYDNIFPAIVPKQLFDDVKAILAKNKIGSRSGQTDFLLKGKLICGLCGKNMHGESGTSHTGKISHYYKCMARKRDKSCTKSTLPKDKFDKLILDVTIQILSDQDQHNRIADGIMRAYEKKMKDTSVLSLLENERKETRRALENIMKAIESGIFNTTTQTRMNELEKQLTDIEDKIKLEKYNEQKILTKEKVMTYLTTAILKKPKTLMSDLYAAQKKATRGKLDGLRVFPFRGDYVTKIFKHFCPAHKLHDLRHTFATRCAESNMQPSATQRLLGHSKIDMTMRVYTHVASEFVRNETAKFSLNPYEKSG